MPVSTVHDSMVLSEAAAALCWTKTMHAAGRAYFISHTCRSAAAMVQHNCMNYAGVALPCHLHAALLKLTCVNLVLPYPVVGYTVVL